MAVYHLKVSFGSQFLRLGTRIIPEWRAGDSVEHPQLAQESAPPSAGYESVPPVLPLVLVPVAGVSARQGTQHQKPRHEAEVRVRFAGPDQLVHLIGLGEVVQRLGRGAADRFHRTAQIGQGITDRNQLAALTLQGLFSHVPQTRQGGERETISCFT